jgi:hypothetical protein
VLEASTAEHREARAVEFDRRARRARDEVTRRYWLARAEGQRDRFDRVRGCGKSLGRLHATCRGCGVVHELPARCAHAWFCPACRNEQCKEQRKRFSLARLDRLWKVRTLGLMRSNRRGGAWSEKFMTFTVPHRGIDDRTGEYFVLSPEERVRMRDEAFPKLVRELRRFWKPALQGTGLHAVPWRRQYEWTPGTDGLGHPHVHVWALCPYLPKEMLREWWYRALCNVGWRGGRSINYPDVRAPYGKELERELIKYLVKDLVEVDGKKDGSIVDPEVYATAYKLHDGKRRSQSSRGLMSDIPKHAPCGECKASFGHDMEFDRRGLELAPRRAAESSNVIPLKRGPPS